MISFPPRRTGIPAVLGALALAACLAAPAGAQEGYGLRGTVAEPGSGAATRATPGTAGARRAPVPAARPPQSPAQPLQLSDPEDDAPLRAALDNERVGAVEGRAARPQDAFAPLGIRAGSFILRPRLEQGIGWTSNAAGAPGSGASTFSETRLRLDAQSDLSRHAASLSADMRWRKSLSGEEIDELEGGVNGRAEFDLGHDVSAFAAGGYRAAPESASTPGTVAASVTRPLRHTLDASAGVARDAGLLRLGLTGTLTREMFGDAELADGSRLSQRERDSTLATVALRAGYAVSPALTPFVEAEIGRRFHDLKRDSAGYARSADRYALRGGVAFDFGEKLSGEISAGWLTERPDDERLDAISGPSVAGNLSWSPVRGTVVSLAAATAVEVATAPGATGSLLYSGTLSARRELRANLTGELAAGLDWRDYSGGGTDRILRGEASLTWWMNRHAGITARASHEVQESTLPGRDWNATSVWLGVTLQR